MEHRVLHKLLLRQLQRSGFNEEAIANEMQSNWNDFLSKINQSYLDHDQEYYLAERSITISSREMQEYYDNIKVMQHQLISISRQAGMAEVATSILHNVGNILNSANVSISLLLKMIPFSSLLKLEKVVALIQEHHSALDDYFVNDKQGQLIPPYLVKLIKGIKQEQSGAMDEIKNLNRHIDHIKDIVLLQNGLSGIIGVKEPLLLDEIINLAIDLSCNTSDLQHIQLLKDFHNVGTVFMEKGKLIQILVNLIRNAKEAIESLPIGSKKISITVQNSVKPSFVDIIIKDNGVGIAQENLMKVFSFGYTTKPTGHGFGLNASSISANELEGQLLVKSDGLGKGAIFTLTLPKNMNGDE